MSLSFVFINPPEDEKKKRKLRTALEGISSRAGNNDRDTMERRVSYVACCLVVKSA